MLSFQSRNNNVIIISGLNQKMSAEFGTEASILLCWLVLIINKKRIVNGRLPAKKIARTSLINERVKEASENIRLYQNQLHLFYKQTCAWCKISIVTSSVVGMICNHLFGLYITRDIRRDLWDYIQFISRVSHAFAFLIYSRRYLD